MFQLHSLLNLRRDVEDTARQALDRAAAARVREEAEQARLLEAWEAARARLKKETARLSAEPAPTNGAEANSRERYRQRLRAEVTRLAGIAEKHRNTVLAAAIAGETEARRAFEQAHRERETVEKLKQRADAEDKKIAERRAEDAASDLAQAAFVRRKSE
jgi:flagellar biosynthesis chaperone FliJ